MREKACNEIREGYALHFCCFKVASEMAKFVNLHNEKNFLLLALYKAYT